MAQKLGEIKKPKITEFKDTRKLFCLPLIPQLKEENKHDDLNDYIKSFWREATHQINDLERIGKISYIFFESITKNNDQGLESIKQISKQSYDIIKDKIDKGAKLTIIENEEILNEYFDWSICLSVIRRSPKVFNKVLEFQQDSSRRRNEEITRIIENTLKENESGLLIITDDNRMEIQSKLPIDIQVFLIHPPSYNDITRWLTNYWKKQNDN